MIKSYYIAVRINPAGESFRDCLTVGETEEETMEKVKKTEKLCHLKWSSMCPFLKIEYIKTTEIEDE